MTGSGWAATRTGCGRSSATLPNPRSLSLPLPQLGPAPSRRAPPDWAQHRCQPLFPPETLPGNPAGRVRFETPRLAAWRPISTRRGACGAAAQGGRALLVGLSECFVCSRRCCWLLLLLQRLRGEGSIKWLAGCGAGCFCCCQLLLMTGMLLVPSVLGSSVLPSAPILSQRRKQGWAVERRSDLARCGVKDQPSVPIGFLISCLEPVPLIKTVQLRTGSQAIPFSMYGLVRRECPSRIFLRKLATAIFF